MMPFAIQTLSDILRAVSIIDESAGWNLTRTKDFPGDSDLEQDCTSERGVRAEAVERCGIRYAPRAERIEFFERLSECAIVFRAFAALSISRRAVFAAGIAGISCLIPVAAEEAKPDLAAHFGFGEMQIYKLQPGMRELHIADFNHDGKNDICVWNPYKNYFDLLYQTDEPAPEVSAGEQNEIPDRGKLKHETHTVAYNVATSGVADFTGDDRADIVFFGEPQELVILPQKADGGFAAAIGVRADDGAARIGMLAVGDFNNDGRKDVALMGDEYISLYLQKEEGGLGSPTRIRHTLRNPLLLTAADINADGRDDLIQTTDDDRYGAHVMLQQADGQLGSLLRIKVPKLRSITVDSARKGTDVYAVQYTTGRLLDYRWAEVGALASSSEWPVRIYSFPDAGRAKRQPFAVGDLNGDEILDVVTASGDGAKLLYLEGTADGFKNAASFPGLQKAVGLQIVDSDSDGTTELLSVSAEERVLGFSAYDSGRIEFPKMVPSRGKVTAAGIGLLTPADDAKLLAYVSTNDERKSFLCVRTNLLDDAHVNEFPIADMRDDPAGLQFADLNNDGLNDILLFVQFSPLITFLQNPDGSFRQLAGASTGESLVKTAPLEGSQLFDINGDGRVELLLPQKTFARALRIDDDRWTIVDQFNAASSDAEITGVCAWRANEKVGAALYDRRTGDISMFTANEAGSLTPANTISAEPMDLIAFHALPQKAAKSTAFLVADTGKLLLLSPLAADSQTLVEQASYNTDAKDAYLADAIIGDINHDGITDLAVLDIRKAAIEILTSLENQSLERVMRFQVFQGKRFSDSPDRIGEPRIGMMEDVTGDKIDDLVILVHDRVIIYPGM